MRKVVVSLALLSLVAAAFVPAAEGQRPWRKKPYQRWSMGEVLQVLSNPPLAQTELVAEGEGVGGLPSVQVRLFSARPVREALVRLRQLRRGYDKLAEQDRARFDADTKDFLDCPDCSKYYVVTVSEFTPDGLVKALGETGLEDLRRHVTLTNERGEGRPLAHAKHSKGDEYVFVFAFERLDERGAPLLTPGHKKLHLRIDQKLFERRGLSLKRVTFEVPRLVENGEIMF